MPDDVMNFAFLADGDKSAAVQTAIKKKDPEEKKGKLFWPLLCLPGDPDVLMKSAAEPNANWLAQQLRITEESLRGTLERLRGREAHNWVEGILAETTIDRQSTLRALATSFTSNASEVTLGEFKDVLITAGMIAGGDNP